MVKSFAKFLFKAVFLMKGILGTVIIKIEKNSVDKNISKITGTLWNFQNFKLFVDLCFTILDVGSHFKLLCNPDIDNTDYSVIHWILYNLD